MSTGDAKLSIAAKYDAAADKANTSAPTKSDKIKDAYDLCVLDFWVKTKEDGSIYLKWVQQRLSLQRFVALGTTHAELLTFWHAFP
jgi:hypothetical protein